MKILFSCLNFKFEDAIEIEEFWLKIREFKFKFNLIFKIERIGRIISFKTRDFIKANLAFPTEHDATILYTTLQQKINNTTLENLPCFKSYSPSIHKYSVYEPESDLFRNFKGDWRITESNSSFEFYPTYPSKIGIPSRISDNTLRYVAKFRSKGRIPALSYLHGNGRGIVRSAQPLTGLKVARSIQDEKLVEAVFCSNGGEKGLVIDARPLANAMAQTAMGAGVEIFLGIENIHIVRDAFQKLLDICTSDTFTKKDLEKSSWLRLLKPIIDGTAMIIQTILDDQHVLVHCSDGWDRTAQLSSLAEICLDPFYRTIDGLMVVLEKEWQAFGHKFQDRTGIITASKTSGGVLGVASRLWGKSMGGNESSESTGSGVGKETSPVFPQFLDCLYQIWKVYPTEFEYDEKILEFLFIACYSCEFSNFLFNNQKEMKEFRFDGMRVEECTNSVWQYIAEHKSEFVNSIYTPTKDVIIPHSLDLVYWTRMYKISNKFVDNDLGSASSNAREDGYKPRIPTPRIPSPIIPSPAIAVNSQEDLYNPSYAPSPKPDLKIIDLESPKKQSLLSDSISQSTGLGSAPIPLDGEMVDLQDLTISSQISNPLMKNPWS